MYLNGQIEPVKIYQDLSKICLKYGTFLNTVEFQERYSPLYFVTGSVGRLLSKDNVDNANGWTARPSDTMVTSFLCAL